jgi:hypothetical protein
MGTAATAETVSIQLEGRTFTVKGWRAPRTAPAKGWPSVFAVYSTATDFPPMLGTYQVQNETLSFRPTFPLAAGVKYRAVFHPPSGGAAIVQAFEGPAADNTRRTSVEHVYPSGDVLPSNLLRLYIYFSAPMSQGEAPQRMRLTDSSGKALQVFLPGEELWDPQFQRLTMTLDPGRIKRGLTSNTAMGAPIVPGKRYELVIDAGWLDARGVPMISGFRKTFTGGPAERVPPDPKQWRLTAPKAGTSGELTVEFPKPMNYALLGKMLQVAGGAGPVAGTIQVDRSETRWRFTPREAWKAGDYRLVVNTAIEDLAGNSVGRPFDIDTFERVTEHLTTSTIPMPFTVR